MATVAPARMREVATPPLQIPSGRSRLARQRHLDAHETLQMRDLTLWKRTVRGAEFAVRPPDIARPNPLVVDSLVIASVWSPGAICAVERGSGRPVWRQALRPLAHDSVQYAEGLLYAHALHTLYALDPSSGEIVWIWRPTPERIEQLHAAPTVDNGRLFIGDQAGRFWCLDARSGRTLWCQEPSWDQALPISATAVTVRGLVVVATREAVAVAYDVETGREVWRQKLDGPAGGELFRFKGGVALRTFWSVYLLGAKDGRVEERWHWRGRYTRHLAATRDSLLVVTQKAHGDMSTKPASVLLAAVADHAGPTLIGLGLDGERFQRPCSRSLLGVRWSEDTGLVYESRIDGLGILDPRTGDRLYDLVSPGDRTDAHCGLVDVRDHVIYMLGVRGVVRAMRHPARTRSRPAGNLAPTSQQGRKKADR